MTLTRFLAVCSAIILLASGVDARTYMVNQIPNGSKFGCGNCHVSASGGGAKNSFGTMVGNKYLVGGNVQWGKALGEQDADGDKATNGTELQDPAGAWVVGNPDPGNPAAVTNPGDSKSKPDTRVEPGGDENSIGKLQVEVHPMFGIAVVKFSIIDPGETHSYIYNLMGKLALEAEYGSWPRGTTTWCYPSQTYRGRCFRTVCISFE